MSQNQPGSVPESTEVCPQSTGICPQMTKVCPQRTGVYPQINRGLSLITQDLSSREKKLKIILTKQELHGIVCCIQRAEMLCVFLRVF
ncbi:MAG: DUF1720 domain-containing protein [Treponema sp.]|nr:DUF1720 domain-containing protein [Treponema sp.]